MYRASTRATATCRTLFTIHNIAYQGAFPHDADHLTGLTARLFNPRQLEFHGHFNFLKAGIVFADAVNTVSPTYAARSRRPSSAAAWKGVLSERRDQLSGIVNGVDYDHWDPATDPHIADELHAETVFDRQGRVQGGPAAAASACRRSRHAPLLGMVARLVEQKGIDLVVKAADGILELRLPDRRSSATATRDTTTNCTPSATRYPRQVGLRTRLRRGAGPPDRGGLATCS